MKNTPVFHLWSFSVLKQPLASLSVSFNLFIAEGVRDGEQVRLIHVLWSARILAGSVLKAIGVRCSVLISAGQKDNLFDKGDAMALNLRQKWMGKGREVLSPARVDDEVGLP